MKKILFIGIGDEKSSKQRMTKALIENGQEYEYVRWTDISFFGEKMFAGQDEIDFDVIGAVFFDTPRFSIMKRIANDKKNEISFHLGNELNVLLSILKEKNIYSPNMDFFLKYPFYNKFSQSYMFSANNVAAIPTIHLSDNKIKKITTLLVKNNFNFPLIAKESHGESGGQVWKIENQEELEVFCGQRRNENVIFQPYIENNADYRVIIVDGQCAGIMKRSAKNGEWKNNFSLGGDIESHDDEEMKKFAIKACKKMNLDIAGLDIFSTASGYLVIEANLFFGLDGFEKVFKQSNVSEKILKMMINKIM